MTAGRGRRPAWRLLGLALGVLVAGCRGGGSDPETVLKAYFGGFQRGDFDAQYRLLLPAARVVEARADFVELQAMQASRRTLVAFEVLNRPAKGGFPDPWRAWLKLTWANAAGRKETFMRGLTLTRRGGRWWVDDAPAARRDANEAYVAGEPARATRQLQRILRFNPEDAEALDLLGYVLRDNAALRNNLEMAVDAHRQAVDLEPRNPDWHVSLGNDYRLIGWPQGAVTELRKAADLDGKASTYVWLGVAYAASQQLDAARNAWGRALKIDPGNAQAHAFLSKTK